MVAGLRVISLDRLRVVRVHGAGKRLHIGEVCGANLSYSRVLLGKES